MDMLSFRQARVVTPGEILEIGKHRPWFRQTPYVVHNWGAGLLFE